MHPETSVSSDSAKPIAVHLVTSLDFGGVESHMETLARHAADASMRLVFCAIGGGGAVEHRLRALGADVRCLHATVRLPALSSILALRRLFRQLRPLAVHTHGAEANFCGLLAAWLAGVPVRVGEEIGMPAHGAKARAVFRGVYRFSHRVIGISQAVVDWLVASREVPGHKAVRLYNPVELPAFGQAHPPAVHPLRIGFVGRLEAVKNPAALIDALAELSATGHPAELWLIGDGSQRSMLDAQARARGVAVVFHGYQDDPARLVRQCHVYVQPSLSEGFGLAFVEAMGCGVPVIVTETGGAREIVDNGVTGWIVPAPEPRLLAEALRVAQGLGAAGLAAMGRRARASVETRFQPAAYLAELHALYLRIRAGAARTARRPRSS